MKMAGKKNKKIENEGENKENKKVNVKENDQFNTIITGVGGQGVMTLGSLLALAGHEEGKNVMTSELHGLAKRFGHTEFHFRMGNVTTTIVPNKSADLIIALEPLESLPLAKYCDKEKTIAYIDSIKIKPTRIDIEGTNYPDIEEIKNRLKSHCKEVIVVNASSEAKRIAGSSTYSNIYILGKIIKNKHIGIKQSTIIKILEEQFGKDNINITVLKEAMKE
jgi:indolepyruvate ferredoxin oxidoreductase beta subunit